MFDCANAVLIVDDNASIRSALRMFLENNLQMRICGEAANGVEAISIAQARHPGVVVMDLSMPSMNGVEAASIIKKTAPDSRIIVFTLYSDSVGETMAKAVGVDVVVSKTEGTEALVAALRPFLSEDFTPIFDD